MPPIFNIGDELFKHDLDGMAKAYEKNGKHGVYQYIRKNRIRSYRYIPVVGKQLYHWNDDLMPVGEFEVAKYGFGRGNVADRKWAKKRAKGQ